METGRGRTINISSSGILIETDRALPVGLTIELSIAWPARLHNVTALQLCVKARAMRIEGSCTALKIFRYEFRIRPPVQVIRPEAGPTHEPAADINHLQTRLNASFEEVSRMSAGGLDAESRAALRGLVDDYRTKLDRLATSLHR